MFHELPVELRRYNVLYLDECPHAAAQAVADQHISQCVIWAAQILSAVWWCHSLPHDAPVDSTLKLDWAPDGQAPPGQGQWSNATLFGQRIYFAGCHLHPHITWASDMGGNYDWLWRHATELCAIYRALGRIHACTPVLRVLEVMPPKLASSEFEWFDAPNVTPDGTGYVEYYSRQPDLKYSTRPKPYWL